MKKYVYLHASGSECGVQVNVFQRVQCAPANRDAACGTGSDCLGGSQF